LAPDDPQGRCSNCIRLKKECNFYPVEHNPDMPQPPTMSSKPSNAVQPATPVATSPRNPLSASSDGMGEFRTPLSGPNAPYPSYGYHGEADNDPHHAPTSNGRKCCEYLRLPNANIDSTRTATSLPLSPSNRDTVAPNKRLSAIIHCSGESFMAALAFYSKLSIR